MQLPLKLKKRILHSGKIYGTDWFTACVYLDENKPNLAPWPVDTLGSQAGGGEDLLDMSLPAGSLELAQPAVHAVGLVVTRLHQLYQALLEDVGPGKWKIMSEQFKLILYEFQPICTKRKKEETNKQTKNQSH